MTEKKEEVQKLEKSIEALADQPSGEKLMQVVVMTAGPGTRMLEFTRLGAARKGIKLWVEDERVVWLTTDRSALMPVPPGELTATFEVRGTEGQKWRIHTSKPADATGGTSRTLPASGRMVGQISITVP